jgi:hypothetical protein
MIEVFAAGAAALTGIAAYARWIEPRRLCKTVRRVPLPLAAPPVRLLHLSDFHLSPGTPLPFIRRSIELGLSLAPDIACLTGDFITAGEPYDRESYRPALARLASSVPTFAVTGNHDGGRWAGARGGETSSRAVRDLLAAAGVTLLHNRWLRVTAGAHPLILAGLGDPWAMEMDGPAAFSGLPPGAPVVLLAHNPDMKAALDGRPWDLMLSGHTHGGQTGIPGLRSLLAPVADRGCVAGLKRWRGSWVHVTPGIGSFFQVRFLCPPEVSLLLLGG